MYRRWFPRMLGFIRIYVYVYIYIYICSLLLLQVEIAELEPSDPSCIYSYNERSIQVDMKGAWSSGTGAGCK